MTDRQAKAIIDYIIDGAGATTLIEGRRNNDCVDLACCLMYLHHTADDDIEDMLLRIPAALRADTRCRLEVIMAYESRWEHDPVLYMLGDYDDIPDVVGYRKEGS